MTVVSVERFDGEFFSWYESRVKLENGMVLDVFFEINEREFRLFHAENLTWPQRNAIRDKMLTLFEEMLALENTAA